MKPAGEKPDSGTESHSAEATRVSIQTIAMLRITLILAVFFFYSLSVSHSEYNYPAASTLPQP
ncbi:MAG: hypothetical protein L0922_06070, partial [Candidatus Mariimomonas ferrooxydans]